MKKLLLTIGIAVIGVSSFAQGLVIFGTGGGYVWNVNSTKAASGIDTAFLFSTAGSNPGASITSVMTSTPTNSSPASLTTAQNTTAWNDVLNDPNFHLAFDNGSSATVVGTTTGAGGISYNGGSGFVLNGTSASGGSIWVYAIAWSSAYATPALAAAANSILGWSSIFQYNYVAGPTPGPAGTPTSMSAQVTGWQFGVLNVVSTPEPSTMALAALGGASLLLFRRRK